MARLLCRGAAFSDVAPPAAHLRSPHAVEPAVGFRQGQDAEQAAEAVAALIDGFYIRRALRDGLPNPFSAVAIIEDYVDAKLATKALS